MVQTKFKIKNNLMLYDVAAELMKETPDEVVGFTYQTIGKLNGVQTTVKVDDVILSLQGYEIKIVDDYGDFVCAEYKFTSPGTDRGESLVSSWEQITLGKNMIEEIMSDNKPIYQETQQVALDEEKVVDQGGPLGTFDAKKFHSKDLVTQINIEVDKAEEKVTDVIDVFMNLDYSQINQENKLLRFALLYIIKM